MREWIPMKNHVKNSFLHSLQPVPASQVSSKKDTTRPDIAHPFRQSPKPFMKGIQIHILIGKGCLGCVPKVCWKNLGILRGDVYPNIMPRPWVRNSDHRKMSHKMTSFLNVESFLPGFAWNRWVYKWGEITLLVVLKYKIKPFTNW